MTGDKETPGTMAYGYKSDHEVADMVRMLMRHDLNHESVVCAARDRIMFLNQQVQKWKDIAEEAACARTSKEACEIVEKALKEEQEAIREMKVKANYDSGRKDDPKQIWIIRHVLCSKDISVKILDNNRQQLIPEKIEIKSDFEIHVDMGIEVSGMWIAEKNNG